MNEPCWSYISDNGKVAVDFVGRVENIKQDWSNLCRMLGTDIELPRVNTSPADRLVYSDSMKQLVEDIFHKDLELYGHRIPA